MKMYNYILSVVLVLWLPLSFGDEFVHDKQNANLMGTLSSQEIDWLRKGQTIRYVYDPDWPPFEYTDESKTHAGIIADLLNVIKTKTGLQLEAVTTETWAESVDLVKSGGADMFSAITINEERKDYLHFSSEDIYTYPAALVTKFEDTTVYIDFAKDSKFKKIGIVKGSGLGKYIQNTHPGLNFLEVDSTHQGFELLAAGEIDNLAINTVTAKYFIENKGYDNLKIGLILDYQYHLKIAVSKKLPKEVISILDKSLKNIAPPTLDSLFTKWTKKTIQKETDWSVVYQVISVATVITLFLMWNTRRLNHLVKERTRKLSNAVKKLNQLATMDPLTEIANRRKYEERLNQELASRNRAENDLSLLVLDIDDFKEYNDTYGHDNGDLILKKVAQKIKKTLPRKTDFVARYGGEEFVVILPATDSAGAHSLAESLRRTIEKTEFTEMDGTQKTKVTVSIGIATISGKPNKMHNIFKQADTALYQAKENGKNIVQIYQCNLEHEASNTIN